MKRLSSIQTVLQESSPDGKTWKVVLIEAGLSKNGKLYPAEVLKKAVSLFNNAKAFFYQWKDGEYNHLSPTIQRMRPEGFPRQIAGWYTDPKFEEVDVEGEKRLAITAMLHIHEGAKWLQKMLRDAWSSGMKRLLGLSIDAEGETGTKIINGRPIEVVTSLKNVFGVDLVTHPAAGGQFVRLVASQMIKGGNMDREKLIAMIKQLRPELLEGVTVDELTDIQLEDILKKAMKEQDETMKCPKCGAEIPKDSEKCPKCGADLKEEDEAAKKKREEEEAAAKKKKEEEEAKGGGGAAEADEAIKKAGDEAEKKATEEGRPAQEALKLREEAQGEATIKHVLGLIKEKKVDVAQSLLEKWLLKSTKDGKGDSQFKKEAEDLLKKISAMDEKLAIVECNKVLDGMLKEANLPDVVKQKISKRYRNKKFDEANLKESIKEEKETLAALTSDGDVNLGDFGDIEVGRTGLDRMQASLDLMLEPSVDEAEKEKYAGINGFDSLREGYVKITHDSNISGIIPPKRLQEATTGDFTYMLGTSMYRKLAREYKLAPALWKELADVVSVKDFKTQEIIRWGGFANLEAVPESDTTDTYEAIAFPGDEEATYSASTRGGIVTITRKMIINDDLRSLQKLPTKIARAAVRTLNQFVFDLLLNYSGGSINGGTIYDGLALYHANHFNLGTAELDYDSYGDAVDRLKEQKEFGYAADLADDPLNNSDTDFDLDSSTIAANYKVGDYVMMDAEFMGPITVVAAANVTVSARGIWGSTAASHVVNTKVRVVTDDLMLEPGILWVPTDLRTTGESIIVNDKMDDTLANRNPYKGSAKLQVVPRRYLRGDVNNWFLTAKKADVEQIEIGFLGGRKEPELIRQDAPGVGLVFTRDNIRYKVRHEYGGAVVDFRGFQGAIAT